MLILNGGSYYPNSQDIDRRWIACLQDNSIIGFVPSATIKSEIGYMEFFKENMANYKFDKKIVLVDLYNDWSIAYRCSAIYIAGGNTYKLLDVVRKSGFSNFIKQVVNEKIIIGNSAGAVILGQDISSSNDQDIIGLKNTKGLGLVDYLVCPHYSVDKNERLKNLSRDFNQKVIGISEQSAILIDSHKEEIFGNIKIFEP